MNGKPDTLKGSYYANPVVDYPTVSEEQRKEHPEYYGHNIWPAPDEAGIEGFEQAFKDLGRYVGNLPHPRIPTVIRFIFKVGTELATACQPFGGWNPCGLHFS